MARVTVEDCVDKVTNRFELVALAAQRAKDINSGAEPSVDTKKDKHPVTALREIAANRISVDALRDQLIASLGPLTNIDKVDDENLHTEREDIGDEFDYVPEGSDFYVSNDHSDLEDQTMFEDEILEEDDKGF